MDQTLAFAGLVRIFSADLRLAPEHPHIERMQRHGAADRRIAQRVGVAAGQLNRSRLDGRVVNEEEALRQKRIPLKTNPANRRPGPLINIQRMT